MFFSLLQTIVEMLVTSHQNASLLIVLQDNINVTMVIVHFRCIFAIAMMIAVMVLTKEIAKIFNVMVNNSNVRAITKPLGFASQLNENVILKWIVPMAKTN